MHSVDAAVATRTNASSRPFLFAPCCMLSLITTHAAAANVVPLSAYEYRSSATSQGNTIRVIRRIANVSQWAYLSTCGKGRPKHRLPVAASGVFTRHSSDRRSIFIADSIKYGVRFQSRPICSSLVQQRKWSSHRGLSSALLRSLIGRSGTSGLRRLHHCLVKAIPGRHTG